MTVFTGCGKKKLPLSKNRSYTSVIVKAVEERQVEKVIAVSGNVKAKYSAPLVFQASGLVKTILVTAGSKVTKGQTLIELRDDHTKVQVQWAQVNFVGKRAEYKRSQEMYEKKIWSYSQVEKAQTEMESARLELEKAKLTDANMRIIAPFTGYVGFFKSNEKHLLSPGSSIQQGQEVGKMVSEENVVEFALSETDASQVKTGQRVVIQREGGTLLPMSAQVSAKEPFSDPVSHMVTFITDLGTQSHVCQDGTFVKVRVTLKDAATALVVPQEAVVPQSGQYWIYVIKDLAGAPIENGKKVSLAKAIEVVPGPQEEGYISIGEKLQGIQVGDFVVTEPADHLRDGQGVIVTKQ
jgi:membrane fusion protein (multidrug efflux system)